MNYPDAKMNIFIRKVIDSCNQGDSISFDSSVTNLYELCRQYKIMPSAIQELAEPKLLECIYQYINTSSFKKSKEKDLIYDKFVKKLEKSLDVFHVSKISSCVNVIYDLITNSKVINGCMKNLKKLLQRNLNSITELTKEDMLEFQFISELAEIVISYLIHKGHSYVDLYSNFNNYYSRYLKNEISIATCFNETYAYIERLVFLEMKNYPKVGYSIRINKSQINVTPEILSQILSKIFSEDKSLKEKIVKHSIKETQKNHIVSLSIYNVDIEATKEILLYIINKLETFFYQITQKKLKLFVYEGNKKIEMGFRKKNLNLNLKYFNQLWVKTDWKELSSENYNSIWRIADWSNILNDRRDNRILFTSLWSSLEFILIGDSKGEKKQLVYERLIPYMGLFYFRKSFKLSFKNLAKSRVEFTNDNIQDSYNELADFISQKVRDMPNNTFLERETKANTYLYFLLNTRFETRWDEFNFKHADSLQYILESEMLLINLKERIQQFETVVHNDLDQIYRLRNMLTHGGVNDHIVLNSSIYRLSYYVQTIINSISYTWIHDSSLVPNLAHLHDLKIQDYKKYKSTFKNDLQRRNFKGWKSLLELNTDYCLKVPNNKYASFGVE